MVLSSPDSVLLVGAGRMGCALLRGWFLGGMDSRRVRVLDPEPSEECRALAASHGFSVNPAKGIYANSSGVFLAVKPQIMGRILVDLGREVHPGAFYVSLAAGCKMQELTAHLGQGVSIVRAMPSILSAVMRGVTVALAGEFVTSGQRKLVGSLLRLVGEVFWVETESLLDVATAVSGSGPAYVFYLTECLTDAAVEAGLSVELASALARATVEGAGEMMYRSPHYSPEDLRRLVTSPGGTTDAALSVLQDVDGLRALLSQAVRLAVIRADSLARGGREERACR